ELHRRGVLPYRRHACDSQLQAVLSEAVTAVQGRSLSFTAEEYYRIAATPATVNCRRF
ncbi:hypothetical protein G7L34_26575, partial [Klebsiella quasipneumoniae]|nr:hypothetical protein [Klebsiella quasipneumoniae]